jgi:uncharacterized protein (DUF58 family)
VNALRAAIARGARRSPRRGTARTAARPGDGLEFSQLRGYVDGDDPRRIDWAATARSGGLQTRVYYEETALVLAALVDPSASMQAGRRRPLATAADEALHAWYGAAEADDRVLRIAGERLVSGRGAVLAVRPERHPFALDAGLRFALRVLPRNASLLVITDGFGLADDDALLAETAFFFDATVLFARDPWRTDLPLRGWRRVRDSETGAARILRFGRAARERFARAVAEREHALEGRFTRAGWRVGAFDERDGVAGLEAAFGLR